MSEITSLAIKDGVPVLYEAAVNALAICMRIDECRGWKAKAAALEEYAREAHDESLFNAASKIKARAIRRQGELLEAEEAKAGGGDTTRAGRTPAAHQLPRSQRKATADAAGLTDRERKTALRLARIPEAEFQKALDSPKRAPTVSALAAMGKVRLAPARAPNRLASVLKTLARIRLRSPRQLTTPDPQLALRELAAFEKWLQTLKSILQAQGDDDNDD